MVPGSRGSLQGAVALGSCLGPSRIPAQQPWLVSPQLGQHPPTGQATSTLATEGKCSLTSPEPDQRPALCLPGKKSSSMLTSSALLPHTALSCHPSLQTSPGWPSITLSISNNNCSLRKVLKAVNLISLTPFQKAEVSSRPWDSSLHGRDTHIGCHTDSCVPCPRQVC